MDFRHLIVTCLFSMLRLSFETQKIKENYAIFYVKSTENICKYQKKPYLCIRNSGCSSARLEYASGGPKRFIIKHLT